MFAEKSKNEYKAERILTRIQGHVGGQYRISRRGVPHLVIGGVGGHSVCYFGADRYIAIYSGYATLTNRRIITFKEWQQVVRYLTKRRITDEEWDTGVMYQLAGK